MKMKNKKLVNTFTLLLVLTITGCSSGMKFTSVNNAYEFATTTFVAKQLGQAVEEAYSNLATLSHLRGKGVEILVPPPDPKLAKELTVSWTGSPESILKNICLEVGYPYRQIGQASQEIPIVVYGNKTSAYTLLEDVALQVQPKAFVKVDTIGQIITLAYPINKE